jgi:hypothetical protein
LKPGTECKLVYGVYNPESGVRLRLSGPDVGDQRIRVGHLVLEGEGDDVSGVGWKPYVPQADPYRARWNVEGKPVDFGAVTTAGGCRLSLEQESLLITPLPGQRTPAFDVSIEWGEMKWKLPQPTHVDAIDEHGAVLSTEPVSASNGIVKVNCQPGCLLIGCGKKGSTAKQTMNSSHQAPS